MVSTLAIRSQKNSHPASRRNRQKLTQFHLESLENRQLLSATYYVAPTGSDTASGSSTAPFKTLQTAVSKLKPGDTLDIRSGTYAGFILAWDPSGLYGPIAGTATAQITIQADPAAAPGSVIINSGNHYTGDAIDFEPGPSYITIQGLTIQGNSSMGHGIRIGQSTGIQLLNNTISNVSGFGIFTSHTTDGVIQGNTVSNTQGAGTSGHGIYVSNSAVRPIVRGNILFNNGSEGLHMNGDVSQGGSGVITGAIVEDNIIYNNVANGINCDGVQNSTFQNNLIYNNGNHGITLYRIDGSAGSTNNRIINNTIYEPNSGGGAIKMMDGSSGNVVFNNVLVGGQYGAYDVSSDSLTGLVSDYNVVVSKFVNETAGTISSLAQWQSSGKDQHSFVATASQLFVNQTGADYHLKSGSLAIDTGVSSLSSKSAPTDDLAGNARPQGSNWDIGAFEVASGDTAPPTISSILTGGLASTSASVSWNTNELSDSQVEYGTTTSYGSATALNTTLILNHSTNLLNLQPGTVYHYRVRSRDLLGNLALSSDLTFTTPAALMGDINHDGIVDSFDLNVIASHWQATVPANTLGDITGLNGVPDGVVDAFDINALASNWQRSS